MKRKIVLSLSALFLFFSIGAAIAVLYMTDTTSELNRIIELHQVEQLRRSLVINLQTVQSNLYTVNTTFANELDSIVKNVMALEETARKCSSCHHPAELANRIINMQGLIKDYETHLSYFITTRANSNRLARIKKEVAAMGDNLLAMTEKMSHSATTSLTEKSTAAMVEINHVKIILLITVIVTMFLGILVAVRLTKSVTRPISALVNATRMISSGKLGSTISYNDKTEFGELAEHFNTMSTAVKDGYDKIQKEISEHRMTGEALRESEEKLQSIFNQMQDVFFRTDKDGRIIWVSPSAANMLGYKSTDELMGLSLDEFFASPDKALPMQNELRTKGRVTNYEIEMLRSDGRTIIVSMNSHQYLDKNGGVAGVEGSCRDITEIKKMEEEQLKIEKLESVGILAGGIAHDFNNILTAIVGNIRLAKMSSDSNNSVDGILTEAEEACCRAKDLTSRLLTFSKGGTPVKRITFIKNHIKDWVNFALRGSNVNCDFFIADDLWPVEIDEGQINQVIFNLVINANQAMPDGGTIYITGENVNEGIQSTLPLKDRVYIKITVKDCGTGIPKEYIQKIFDPYFTTKQKGSGLGLSSTYSIIKNHHGYIEVKSEVERGTTFYIYLPAVKGGSPILHKGADRIIKGAGKILLMDDDDTVRKTISKILKQLGYEVELAKDGTEAIELYQHALKSACPFDAVIMDLTISGGMGGEEAIVKLIEMDSDVKAIVSSGYSTDTVMADYKKYGFSGVITKPFDIETLSAILHDIILRKS